MRPLNVATEPFRNEKLPILLTGLLVLATAGLTVAHAMTLSRLLPSQLRQAESEANALESEITRLRDERERLRQLRPEKEDLARWDLIRGLVDRRVFRWTALFARLNTVIPQNVRLIAIEPVIEPDGVQLRLTATQSGGGAQDLLGLVRRFEDEPDFDSAAPESLSAGERGDEIVLRVRYRPVTSDDKPQPTASPAPTAGAAVPRETPR